MMASAASAISQFQYYSYGTSEIRGTTAVLED